MYRSLLHKDLNSLWAPILQVVKAMVLGMDIYFVKVSRDNLEVADKLANLGFILKKCMFWWGGDPNCFNNNS